MPETQQNTEQPRNPRSSFREKVLSRIRGVGIRGITHEEVIEQFRDEPRVKVTVALNELLGRRDAYLRGGIYRATSYPQNESL
ncbi:MAG: hypothetical protein EOP83_15340 [Verrucomicrobiaceae bacterium]|nr:MAG: hypothetical protein EOP83_15340 [Verrucomicrobiaceae bacterium]